jgi:hypothetical protein
MEKVTNILIDILADDFKKGVIDDVRLSTIPEDELNDWFHDLVTSPNDATDYTYFFKLHIDVVFITDDDLLEYNDLESWKNKSPAEIVAMFEPDSEGDAVFFVTYKNVVFACDASVWGQSGIHFSNLQIFETIDDLIKKYKSEGIVLVDGNEEVVSHNQAELTRLYNELVLSRL